MSAKRRGTGDAQSPNRQGRKRDSEVSPSYLYAPASSESINHPDYVASGGADFVPNDSPWRARAEVVSEDDLKPLDLSTPKKILQTSSPNHPDNVASGATAFFPNESPRGKKSNVFSEDHLYPGKRDKRKTKLSKRKEKLQTSSPNHPDNVASGGIAFVPNKSPRRKRPNSSSEDDVYPMDLSKPKEKLQTSSPNHPDYVASGGTDFVPKESPRGTRSEVLAEEDEYPLDLTKPMEKLQISSPKKSSFYSGLDYPSTPKERSSMDKDGGAAGSQNAPSQSEFMTAGITNEQIQFTLLHRELWRDLSRHGNEMIVRYDGCLMSPDLRFTISGLVKNRLYSVFVEFPLLDKYTWMYDKSTWKIQSTAEEQKTVPRVKHQESPSPGGYWMDRALHFENLRICSNIENVHPNKAGLNVFHAYQPTITVVEVDKYHQPKTGTSVSVSFQETSFVVITGKYRNPRVRAIKATIS